jgi:FAD/FMN-containing dehydrogenase
MIVAMLSLLLPLLLTGTSAAVLSERQTLSGSNVCDEIAGGIAGKVYYALDLSPNFSTDIEHFMSSSTETPMCVVEVTGTDDVSSVLKIVGATRTPFAVKSGGHASNPGFSCTTGVHISLAQLTQVNLSEDKKTVEVGLGNVR